MRTTVDLAPEAKSLARIDCISVGEALNRLIRRGRHAALPIREESGFPVFDPPFHGQAVTLERIRELEDEL